MRVYVRDRWSLYAKYDILEQGHKNSARSWRTVVSTITNIVADICVVPDDKLQVNFVGVN